MEETVKPEIEKFLGDRGLSLSQEKTKITHIKHGFTFLGQNFRKHGRKLHVTPSKESVLTLKNKVGELIRKYVSSPVEGLVKKLNQTLRGWDNCHRHVVASEAFSQIDNFVYEQLWRMIHRQHLSRSSNWLFKRYWTIKNGQWIFTAGSKSKKGPCVYQVIGLCLLGVRRYIKIKADANPYDPKYAGYIWLRMKRKISRYLPVPSARKHRILKSAEVQ